MVVASIVKGDSGGKFYRDVEREIDREIILLKKKTLTRPCLICLRELTFSKRSMNLNNHGKYFHVLSWNPFSFFLMVSPLEIELSREGDV